MKLKKIASLMLAGVMVVSMLTACGDKGSSSSEGTVVTPVDNSFAAAVNEEMSTATKNVLTFSSDATLASTLNKVADKVASSTLVDFTKAGFVSTTDAEDFRHLMGIGRTNSLMLGIDNKYYDPFTGSAYKYFSTASSATTVADLVVVPGNLTEEGVAEYVADAAEDLIVAKRMPATGTVTATNKTYRYAYTGNIAMVKVDNLGGDFSAYIVALTVTQTPTEVTNVK